MTALCDGLVTFGFGDGPLEPIRNGMDSYSADVDLIGGYRNDQRRRGLEPTTIDARTTRLRLFARWHGTGLLTAAEGDVQRFLDRKPLGFRTRYAWISHLHCFYEWAIHDGLTTYDPTARIIRPRLRKLIPRPIADADLDLAVRMADRRLRAMLLLAAYEGFRCLEIARLTRDDVLDSYETPILIAHGKGSKDRLVPLHPDVQAALLSLPMPRSGHLFISSRTGRPMTPAEVSHEGNRFLDGLRIDATMHQARHWFGTRLYQRTKDLRLVQEMMGHGSPTTTAGYAAYEQTEAARAISGLAIRRHPETLLTPP